MKRLTTIAVILLISAKALSQDSLTVEKLEQNVKKFHRWQSVGRPLVAVGGILMLTGALMVMTNADLLAEEQSPGFHSGGAMAVIGAIGLGIGLPMSIAGSKGERRYRRLVIQNKFPSLDSAKQEKILDGELWIGMTEEQAHYSLGKPRKIIPIVNSDSDRREKWRYKDLELLITDGILDSFLVRDKEYRESESTY